MIEEFSVLLTMKHWDELKKYIGVDMGSEEGDETVVNDFDSDREQDVKEEDVLVDMKSLIDNLTLLKTEHRSAYDRYIAITITEMEKVMAFFETYIVRGRWIE